MSLKTAWSTIREVASLHKSDTQRRPLGYGTEVFDTPEALAINRARLEHLAGLGLDLTDRRVLDAGCGVGHHLGFYLERGCSVVCVDARKENIIELRQRHPDVEAHVVDVEDDDLASFGLFDVIHCFGLLYHLENPLAGLRNLASVCSGLMVLETIVCDHPSPLVLYETETESSNQALNGLGCRPTPAFVELALRQAGFSHVYRPLHPPSHEDFIFELRGSLESQRDGHNLRVVFIAAKAPLDSAALTLTPESP